MSNKVIIVILVFLVMLSGGFGYYSYTLSQQIDLLSGQLTVFQQQQAGRIDAVSNELTSLRGETSSRFNAIQDDIDATQTSIGSLGDKIDGALNSISDLKGEMSDATAKINTLQDNLAGVTSGLSQSVLDGGEVYQKVSQATVRISDGERTIGSGFIYDSESHVVTANHVIENLTNIYVILPDGRTSKAITAGSSPQSDVAILTMANKLAVEPPTLADSAKIRVGEPVAVIGSPFDLPETLTTGVVSQTNRYTEIKNDIQSRWVPNLIQFDAAANFGNSGGPLANSEGKIIGLVIARVDPNLGDGVYYAVASNKVKKVAESLISRGSFDYPWLGVSLINLTPQVVETRGLETTNGALVKEIAADSPAKAAGIIVDDIIVAIDGLAIRDIAELTSYVGENKSPGESAKIMLIRDQSKLELSLEIGKLPS